MRNGKDKREKESRESKDYGRVSCEKGGRTMQILKRAKSGGELVSFTESSVKDEVDLRTYRAGYTDRHGNPLVRQNISTGWTRRFEENYNRIFRKEK